MLLKFLAFALAMGLIPVGMYFAVVKYYFVGLCIAFYYCFELYVSDYICTGNTTYAAIAATISANLVLAAYVVNAFREESVSNEQGRAKGKEE